MAEWKTDPLIRLVIAEIRALWEELRSPDRPILFRVEQRSASGPPVASSMGRLVNVWLFDDYGIRLAPILRREAHGFGEPRGGYDRYGLVQFEVDASRSRVALSYRVGPSLVGEIVYDVERDGDSYGNSDAVVVASAVLTGVPCHYQHREGWKARATDVVRACLRLITRWASGGGGRSRPRTRRRTSRRRM